jgi:glutaminyl-tRNA synthetase
VPLPHCNEQAKIVLVQENIVNGWDDPRMPTISGLRRRGYTANSIRKFCDIIGVAKEKI